MQRSPINKNRKTSYLSDFNKNFPLPTRELKAIDPSGAEKMTRKRYLALERFLKEQSELFSQLEEIEIKQESEDEEEEENEPYFHLETLAEYCAEQRALLDLQSSQEEENPIIDGKPRFYSAILANDDDDDDLENPQ